MVLGRLVVSAKVMCYTRVPAYLSARFPVALSRLSAEGGGAVRFEVSILPKRLAFF